MNKLITKKIIVSAVALVLVLGFNTKAFASGPTLQTLAQSAVSQTSATLNGFYNSNNDASEVWFQYGTSPSMNQSTSSEHKNAQTAGNFHETITVIPGTTVYFRAMGISASGPGYGLTLSFLVPAYSLPTAQTLAAGTVTSQTAELKGFYNSNGSNTYTWFEYGTTTALGSNTPAISQGISFGNISSTINVLPNTNYFYRIVVKNDGGVVHGFTVPLLTPAGVPTPTQCVINSFTASTYNISYGFSSTLYYSTSGNCNNISISNIGSQNGSTGTAYTGVLYSSTSYTLTASGPNNTASPVTITISVNPISNNGGIGNSTGNTNGNTSNTVNTAPETYTAVATMINKNSAVLNGLAIEHNNSNMTGYFEWGTDVNALYNTTSVQNLGSNQSVSFFNTISNLNANTTYFYRAVSTNMYGVNKGAIQSFTTKSVVVVSSTGNHSPTNGINVNKTNTSTNSLSASAIFGTSFLPSSIIGWLILTLVILAIVFLARQIYKPANA